MEGMLEINHDKYLHDVLGFGVRNTVHGITLQNGTIIPVSSIHSQLWNYSRLLLQIM
jgi:hypothetical protein